MEAPFIFQYNIVTSFLFERVPSETLGGELLDLFNSLGFAYYSSLIFYYIVDYFPTRQKEKRALLDTEEHLTNISVHIEYLFAVLMFLSGKGCNIRDIRWQKDAILELCKIGFDENPIYCNCVLYNRKNNEVIEQSWYQMIIPYDRVKEECEGILYEIDMIRNSVKYDLLEDDVKDIISVLSNNNYINRMAQFDAKYFEQGIGSFFVNCTKEDLLELIGANIVIGRLPIEIYECTIHESSEEDRLAGQATYEKLCEDFPKAVKIFEDINSKNR